MLQNALSMMVKKSKGAIIGKKKKIKNNKKSWQNTSIK